MSPAQISALVRASAAALQQEKISTLPADQQRTLSIVAVCQFCLESATIPQADGSGGWGTSKLSQPPANNPFGIKFSQRLESYGHFDGHTFEIINGERVDQIAQFQQYPTLATAFYEHQRLLMMRRPVVDALPNGWQAVTVALGPWRFAGDAQRANYSTNPKYADVLQQIAATSKIDKPGFLEWYAAGASVASEPLIA